MACDAVSLGERFMTFQKTVVPSRVKQFKFLDCVILEDKEATIIQKDKNH
jgi:hypothetical protein